MFATAGLTKLTSLGYDLPLSQLSAQDGLAVLEALRKNPPGSLFRPEKFEWMEGGCSTGVPAELALFYLKTSRLVVPHGFVRDDSNRRVGYSVSMFDLVDGREDYSLSFFNGMFSRELLAFCTDPHVVALQTEWEKVLGYGELILVDTGGGRKDIAFRPEKRLDLKNPHPFADLVDCIAAA